MRPGGRIRPHRPVADLNNTTINERTRGRGMERPGDGVATSFLEGDFCRIFGRGGGRIEVVICNRAGELDRTAQSLTSTTPKSMSIRGGGGWNGRDMVSRLLFYEGIFVDFLAGWGLRHSDFETMWPNAIKPPGPRQQQHKWPGGIVWAAIRTSPFYHVVIMLKKGLFWVGCGGFFRLKRE